MTTVRFFAAARAAAGRGELAVEFATLQDLVTHCESFAPALAPLLPTCTFLIDGISTTDLSTVISHAREIDILPKFAGG